MRAECKLQVRQRWLPSVKRDVTARVRASRYASAKNGQLPRRTVINPALQIIIVHFAASRMQWEVHMSIRGGYFFSGSNRSRCTICMSRVKRVITATIYQASYVREPYCHSWSLSRMSGAMIWRDPRAQKSLM